MREEAMEAATSLTAQVLEMIALVDYQSGSIVSREIIKQHGGTVTIFAFDEGQGLSEHTAPFDALVIILEGTADVSIAGQTKHLQAGQMIIMPARKPHALKAIGKFKMMLTMIKA
jgi:quercetin dioxygenase-like cupin family protein